MRRAAPLICLLLFVLHLPATADDLTLTWDLPKDQFVAYKVTHTRPAGQMAYFLPFARFGVLASDVNPKGDGWAVGQRHFVPLAVALMLPDKKVRDGKSFDIRRTFKGMLGMIPFKATGKAARRGTAKFAGLECEELRVKVKLVSTSAKKGYYLRVKDGGVEATTYWHAGRKQIMGGKLEGWMRFRYAGQKKDTTEKYDMTFESDLSVGIHQPQMTQLINKAIDDGVKMLRENQAADGSWTGVGGYPMGSTALCLLAALKSGVKSDDPAVKKALANLRKQPLKKTYGVSVLLMAIEALYSPAPDALHAMTDEQRKAALAKIPDAVSEKDRAWVKRLARWLVEKGPSARWWYPTMQSSGVPIDSTNVYDNSNSQYAALGLLAAERLGQRIAPGMWRQMAEHWLGDQEPSGPSTKLLIKRTGDKRYAKRVPAKARGWGYQKVGVYAGGTMAYGSMTAGAVGSLAIVRDALERAQKLERRLAIRISAAVRDGRAWLQRYYSMRANPRKQGWDYYYLYAVERAGVFTRTDYIGEHDWYKEGAAHLIGWQAEKGGWTTTYQTAFALLFLKKATTPLETTKVPK